MPTLDSLRQDLRFGLRGLVRRPGHTAAAVATLALGIGATTAIFTVVHGVLLQPLPLPEPERLVRLYQSYPERGEERGGVSQLDVEDWAEESEALEAAGAYTTIADGLTLSGLERSEKLATAYVSGGFFPALGLAAERGRTLGPADARADDRAVVFAHGLWQRRFGGDPEIVGRKLTLDGEPMTVLGVMPASFGLPSPEIEIWGLLSLIPESSVPRERYVRWLGALGRLAPEVSAADARAELASVAGRLAEQYPDSNRGATEVAVVPLRREMVAEVRAALLLLFAAVGALLLIACVNVASLMLARGVSRTGELAVRGALGAGRGRLARQLLVESLLVALLGGAAGTLLAAWGVEALLGLAAGLLPRASEVAVDGPVLVFAAATAVITALLAGTLPALRLSRPALERTLRRGRDELAGGSSGRVGETLVAVEIALTVVLVVSAGLLARSLGRMLDTDTGFAADRLLSLTLIVPDHRYPERPQYLAQYRRLWESLAALPGVESVASIKVPPLAGGAGAETLGFRVEGRPSPAAGEELQAHWFPVSRGFFRTAGIPLLAGRDFAARDDPEAPWVAVVNRALAERHFPGEDPVGRRLFVAEQNVEIVGLAADARHVSVTEPPEPTLYLHQEQAPRRVVSFLLRTRGEPADLVPAVRDAVAAVDPEQAVTRLAPLSALISESVGLPRLVAVLVVLFSALALALAALGLFGVLAFAVSRRRPEIGIRIALGADGRRVVAEVLRRGMVPVVLGLVFGFAGAAAAARLLGSLLYGVGAADPVSYAAAGAVLLIAALAACVEPARRAAATDPMSVLRDG
jgi:predicted permease